MAEQAAGGAGDQHVGWTGPSGTIHIFNVPGDAAALG
jgi:hypothetical protein